MDAHQSQVFLERWRGLFKHVVNSSLWTCSYPVVRRHCQCFSSRWPDFEIILVVADIVKTAFTVLLNQPLALSRIGQIHFLIRTLNAIKQIKILGDAVGKSLVTTGNQYRFAFFFLGSSEFNDFLIKWKIG